MKTTLLKLFSGLTLFTASATAMAAGACCVAGAFCCGLPCCL